MFWNRFSIFNTRICVLILGFTSQTMLTKAVAVGEWTGPAVSEVRSLRPLIGRISALASNFPYGHNWPNNFNPTFANAAHRYCFDILGHPAHCLICPQRIQTHRDRRTPSGWLWQLPGILGGRGGVRVPAIRQSSMVPDYLGIFLKMGGEARSSQFQKLLLSLT